MLSIDERPDRQTVITTYDVTPGTFLDLLERLRDAYETFLRHQPGFLGAGLHVNDAQTRIASYSQWRSREDFQNVLRSPEMRERNREFSALSKSFEPVLYDVLETFASGR
ncbi:antibiotic biosynthesis monooxygenase family protein [uncultured Paracoccus sp.]|uniref:antibiotic biosynthesis monooxygenase family protein n=1 Tax=uncultured Paracoccus sp. TaxID=189685 RepID=UPI002616D6CF|nr:antibiotic biosynthesis monooxygenase family protein [uncultured Paracoccus sp.]